MFRQVLSARPKVLAGIAAVLFSAGLSASASATTYNLNVDACSSGCGLSNYGTVNVTGDTSSLTIDVELLLNPANLFLHQSNGSTSSVGLYFDLSGSNIAFTGVSNNNNTSTPGWTWTALGLGSYSADALGTGNYAIGCDSTVSGNTCGKSLIFTVTGTDLALNSFSKSHGDIWFVADVSNNGTTGPIGATLCTNCENPPPNETPLPGALPLFTSGMGMLGFLGWRRKRRNAQQTA